MKTNPRQILQVLEHHGKYFANKTVNFSQEKLMQILSGVFSPGPSFQQIYDHHTKKFVYLSDNLSDILGIPNNKYSAELYVDLVHADDVAYFASSQDLAAKFFFTFIPQEERALYKHSYQYHLKCKDNQYKMVLHQAIALSLDENYTMSNVLMNISQIDHITKVNNLKNSFIDIRGKQSYFNISSMDDLNPYLPPEEIMTKREIEILRLLSEGLTSKEISDHLHIAYDTVRTHRNNILKKSHFKTLTQVACHYVKKGLI